jgi:hypothetical protein
MPQFQPGQSGNVFGYKAKNRRKGNAEVFNEIKSRGYLDPLITLAKIQHESENEGIRASAAASLANFCHPKLQSIPTPRFIPTPIDVPEFETIENAERFLARLTALTAQGKLDFQSALELTTMAKRWIDSRAATDLEQRIIIIEQVNGISHTNGTTAVVGGLPTLPGTDVIMPGEPAPTNGHDDKPPLTDPGPTDGEPHEPGPARAARSHSYACAYRTGSLGGLVDFPPGRKTMKAGFGCRFVFLRPR